MTDLFEEKARDWDANERRTRLSQAISRSILAQVPLDKRMTVMDFGAGTGLISEHIAPRVARILAVDISQSMLEKLKEKPALANKVDILCQDIIASPIESRFDLIMSAMALHHIEDTAALFRNFADHLNENGMVALADLDKEDGSFHPEGTEGVFHAGFDRDELRHIMENNGFENIAFVTAHTVNGDRGDFPIFLVTGNKKS